MVESYFQQLACSYSSNIQKKGQESAIDDLKLEIVLQKYRNPTFYRELKNFIQENILYNIYLSIIRNNQNSVSFLLTLCDYFRFRNIAASPELLKKTYRLAHVKGNTSVLNALGKSKIFTLRAKKSYPQELLPKWNTTLRSKSRMAGLSESGVCYGLTYMWLYLSMLQQSYLHNLVLGQLTRDTKKLASTLVKKYAHYIQLMQNKQIEEPIQGIQLLQKFSLQRNKGLFVADHVSTFLRRAVRFIEINDTKYITLSYYFEDRVGHIVGIVRKEEYYYFYDPNANHIIKFEDFTRFIKYYLCGRIEIINGRILNGSIKIACYQRASELTEFKDQVSTLNDDNEKLQLILKNISLN